ncbi:MAG: RNA pseudouridine synthase [Candidatus Staskawiczbacteria bacterium]|nr:RNA pseudouridine synthase [Candidatus Staskawiczbacteria bacterium]
MSNIKVLYEDNHSIAVFKPAGILSQEDKTGDQSLFDQVKIYLKEKYHKPGNVFLGLVHRLDRPVCGIMLFAKTSKGASRLSEQFRNHQVEKTYQAIVIGKPAQNKGVLINKLGKDEKLHKAKEYADGQEAKLFYEIVKSNDKYSLLKIKIEGGKFHQIRSQLSIAGMPILGDLKYKAKEPMPDKNIALCATNMSFRMPTGEEVINLSVDIPKEWVEYVK